VRPRPEEPHAGAGPAGTWARAGALERPRRPREGNGAGSTPVEARRAPQRQARHRPHWAVHDPDTDARRAWPWRLAVPERKQRMRARWTRQSRLAPVGLLGGLAVAAAAAVAVPVATAPPAQAAEPVVVVESTFDDGTTQGWGPRGGETVAASTAAARSGTHGLLVTGRTQSWEGPVIDLLGTMTKGTRYTLSVWVRLA